MLLRIQHQRPDGEVDTYHLKPGRKYYIGRGSSCEIRILDLSLSRKHCALEFVNGEWSLIDLISTNGCKLDGQQVVGMSPLKKDSIILAGHTTLTSVFSTQSKIGMNPSASPSETVTAISDSPTAFIEQESMPAAEATDARIATDVTIKSGEWEPQSVSAKTISGVLEPRHLNAPFKPAVPPVAPQAPSTTSTSERSYVISLLGIRVGPLTHDEARALKAKELLGQLSTADLEKYPRQP